MELNLLPELFLSANVSSGVQMVELIIRGNKQCSRLFKEKKVL